MGRPQLVESLLLVDKDSDVMNPSNFHYLGAESILFYGWPNSHAERNEPTIVTALRELAHTWQLMSQ
jgi:hypothetical protein